MSDREVNLTFDMHQFMNAVNEAARQVARMGLHASEATTALTRQLWLLSTDDDELSLDDLLEKREMKSKAFYENEVRYQRNLGLAFVRRETARVRKELGL